MSLSLVIPLSLSTAFGFFCCPLWAQALAFLASSHFSCPHLGSGPVSLGLSLPVPCIPAPGRAQYHTLQALLQPYFFLYQPHPVGWYKLEQNINNCFKLTLPFWVIKGSSPVSILWLSASWVPAMACSFHPLSPPPQPELAGSPLLATFRGPGLYLQAPLLLVTDVPPQPPQQLTASTLAA